MLKLLEKREAEDKRQDQQASLTKKPPFTYNNNTKREPPECYRCKKKGHFSRYCTEKMPTDNQRDVNAIGGDTIVGAIPKRGGGVISVEVNVVKMKGLLYKGAAISLIRKECCEKLNLKPYPVSDQS